MAWSDPFLSNVQKFEGFNPKSYWDNRQWSIGFGTKAQPGQTITREDAQKALLSELDQARGYVTQRFPSLNPNQTEALSSFTYNLGPAWMKSSNLASALDKGDWQTAAKTMQQYVNANGQPLQGLANRRSWEAQHFLTPAEQAQQQANPQMNLFDPEVLRRALMQQGPMDPNAAYEAPTHYSQQPVPTEGPALQQYGLMPPASVDQPAPAPQQAPQAPMMAMPQLEQKPMGFLDRLSAALNQPMTQQGLGLFLAASQGADLNKGMNAGMDRASAAIKNQEMQRQAQLRDMREAFLSNLAKNPPSNLPAGLAQILPLLGDNAAGILGNHYLNQDMNELNKEKLRAEIEAKRRDRFQTGKPGEFIYNRETGLGPDGLAPKGEDPGTIEFNKEAAKKRADTYNEWVKDSQKNVGLANDLTQLEALANTIGDPGKWGEVKANYGPWAKSLGIDVGDLDHLQAFDSIVKRLAPNMRPPGSGATSDFEMRQYLASLPQISQSPEARKLVFSALRSGLEFQKERARIASEALSTGKTKDAETKIQALIDRQEQESASRLKALGIEPPTAPSTLPAQQPSMPQQTPQQTMQAPQSPDQQMAANIARNNQFPDQAAALSKAGLKTAPTVADLDGLKVGETVTIKGQVFKKNANGAFDPVMSRDQKEMQRGKSIVQSTMGFGLAGALYDLWKNGGLPK